MTRLRQALWILYAVAFLVVAYGSFRDDLVVGYTLFYAIPAAVSYIVVAAGVIAYALRFRPPRLVRLARSFFLVLLAFPLIGLAMDWFLSIDPMVKANSPFMLLVLAIIAIVYTPGYLAIWRLGRHDS
jgi:hypothetical protein